MERDVDQGVDVTDFWCRESWKLRKEKRFLGIFGAHTRKKPVFSKDEKVLTKQGVFTRTSSMLL